MCKIVKQLNDENHANYFQATETKFGRKSQ
jgi:hypothetical protein